MCGPGHSQSPPGQHGQVFEPGPDRIGELPSHDASHLPKVVQVVDHPGGKKLPQGDRAELRVSAFAIEVRSLELERLEVLHIVPPEPREGIEELGQSLAPRLAKLGEAIEGRERARLAMRQQQFYTGHPVSALAVNEVPNNVIRTPGIGALIRHCPRLRKPGEPDCQDFRSGSEDGKPVGQREGWHASNYQLM